MSLMTCEICGREYPIARYPDLNLGVVCEFCLNGAKGARLEEAIKKKTELMARQVASLQPDDIGDGFPKLRKLMASVYRDFGGPDGFAQHFFWVIHELSQRKPMPSSVGSLMLGFMKLHHSVEQTEETIAAREMTDDQLRREMELATVRFIVESAADPDKRKILETVLGKHGLKIEEASQEELLDIASKAAEIEISREDFESEIESLQRFIEESEDDGEADKE